MKVGDKVRVVGDFDTKWKYYVDSMETLKGRVGVVVYVYDDDIVMVNFQSPDPWMFQPVNLKVISDEARFVKKQIQMLKKRLKEIAND